MNRIPATVIRIIEYEGISRILFDADGHTLTMIGLEVPAGVKEGAKVVLAIKATHLVPALDIPPGVALCNALPVTIQRYETGRVLSVLSLKFGTVPMEAIVPAQTLESLGVAENETAFVLFQASELSIVEIGP